MKYLLIVFILLTSGIYAVNGSIMGNAVIAPDQAYDPTISANITEGMEYTGIFTIRVTSSDVTANGYAYFDGSVWANLNFDSGQPGVSEFAFNTFIRSYGSYQFQFVVNDVETSGQKTLSMNIIIKHDYDAPQISLSVEDGGVYNGLFDITVDSNENATGSFYIDGGLYANLDLTSKSGPWTDAFPVNSFAYAYGTHTFTFTLYDDSNNEFTTEFDVTLKTDITPPIITANMVDGGDYSGIFDIEVISDEQASGYFYIDDQVYANLDLSTLTTSFTFNSFAYSNGVHDIAFIVKDDQDNEAKLNMTINISNDYSGPVITTNITDQSTYVGILGIEITTDEPATGYLYLNSLLIANLDLSAMTTTITVNTPDYSDGSQNITIWVEDSNNYYSRLTLIVYFQNYDTTSPEIYTNITDTTYSGSHDFEISFSESVSGTVKLNSTVVKTFSNTNSFTLTLDTTNYNNGYYVLSIEVSDGAGNTNTQNYYITIENIPQLTITTDLDTTTPLRGTVDVQVITNIAVDRVEVFLDSVLFATLDLMFESGEYISYLTIDTNTISDGDHAIVLDAYNDTILFGTLTVSFTVDNSDDSTDDNSTTPNSREETNSTDNGLDQPPSFDVNVSSLAFLFSSLMVTALFAKRRRILR